MLIINIESNFIKGYGELGAALDRWDYQPKPKKLDLDMKNHETSPTRPSVEEAIKIGT